MELISTLTLDEILERYHSDEPVDMARLRAEGEEDAAAEVLTRMALTPEASTRAGHSARKT